MILVYYFSIIVFNSYSNSVYIVMELDLQNQWFEENVFGIWSWLLDC